MLLLGYNQCSRESMGFPVQEVASVTALLLPFAKMRAA
jgi:hypothetical protein